MASILETFAILFETDASEVKKGTEQAKKSTEDLNRSLSQTEIKSNKLGSSFAGMIRSATGIFAAVFSAGAIISGIKGAANYADEIGKLATALELTTEDVDAWSSAVSRSGGSAETFANSAKTLNASLNEFATKGKSRSAPFFKELGIAMVDAHGKARKVVDILPDLAAKFEKISKSEALGIGQKLGLDQGTITLLTEGKVAVQEIIKKQKELGAVTREDADIAEDFNDRMEDLKISFRGLFMNIGTEVLPAFTKVINIFEKIVNFIRKNSDIVKGALIAIGAAVAIYVVPPLVTAAAAALVLYAPFLAWAAIIGVIIGVFALLYEDIVKFQKGQNSLLGEIIKKWPMVGDIIKGIIGTFKALYDYVNGLLNVLLYLFIDPAKAFEIFKHVVEKGINDMKTLFPSLGEAMDKIGEIFNAVTDGIVSAWDAVIAIIKSAISTIMSAIDKVSGAFKKVKDLFSSGDTKVNQNIMQAQSSLEMARTVPIQSLNSSKIINGNRSVSKTTDVKTGDIIINTQASDAESIANSIGVNLKNEMRNVLNEFDDGVAA